MSCAPGPPAYRLLDYLVGWDEADVCSLTDPDDQRGIRLAPLRGSGQDRADFLPWLPGPRLAPGCGRCAWYLAAPERGLLRRDPGGGWRPAWPSGCDPGLARPARAIAARGHLLAAATGEAVYLWRREGGQLAAVIPGLVTALALAPWGEVLLTTDGSADVHRYDLAGSWLGHLVTGISGPVAALAAGNDCTLWALTGADGTWRLWRGTRDGQAPFRPATADELANAVSRTSLTAATEQGFSLTEPGPDGAPETRSYGWDGEQIERVAPPAAALSTAGQLLTRPIDSGQPRCRWHRVRVEADMPSGTSVSVAVSTAEEPLPPSSRQSQPPWQGFAAGPPSQDDWQDGGAASADFLVNEPPGRYLYLRLRLTGNGTATPVVHRVRLDFPRATSASLLPAVYSQDPAAADFTERFLSLFDAAFEDADRAVERYPALLDSGGVPGEVLPWLGGLLGLAFDPGLDATIRRKLLAAAPALYRGRGTAAALHDVIQIVFGLDVAISEQSADRAWAGLGRASRLGSTRLFGRSRARFQVGRSALSATQVRAFGNPDDDPLTAHANRIRVLVPRSPRQGAPDLAALRQLVATQAPAHTVADIQLAGPGFVAGVWSAVGVDTVLAPLPAPVLDASGATGAGQPVTLGRHSVLWPSARGSWAGIAPGAGLAVGLNTVAR